MKKKGQREEDDALFFAKARDLEKKQVADREENFKLNNFGHMRKLSKFSEHTKSMHKWSRLVYVSK